MMLEQIEKKIRNRYRISQDEAIWLFEQAPMEWLREQADWIRKELYGDAVYFNRNVHFEPSNKCVYACKFCAFRRSQNATEEDGAWDYSIEDLGKMLDQFPAGSLTEIHVTGGVYQGRGIEYAEELISFIKEHRPELHVKAFTAIEVDYFARTSGISILEALRRMKAAGLESLPGGGAEIFNPEVRSRIAGGKAPSQQWLAVHEAAHSLGIKSNATILYGHVENASHRVEHLNLLRVLQDRTYGFQAFIPLRYHDGNNALGSVRQATEEEDLRMFCVARIFLDNIPHLKAYWVMLGMETALKALKHGADDLDGTVNNSTRIYSMAGGPEHPVKSPREIKDLIESAGMVPVERDSMYEKIFK